jgi:membrane protein DedA with SNARE-associated domain
VFFGRFILGLRVWASWLAGATHMHWRSFLLWNALGGICWATVIGLLSYYLGQAAGDAVKTFGLYGLAAAVLAIGSAIIVHRRHRRARLRSAERARAETAAPNPGDE